MKKINCVVADDEELARGIIENYIGKVEQLHLVASCFNGAQVYNALKNNPVDLLFLDIQMPQLTGIELLRTLKDPPRVIVTTAFREFALEGYELNVIDYLLKPVPFDRFLRAIDKAMAVQAVVPSQPEPQRTFIDVRSDRKMIRIVLRDILYVEGLKDYVKIHTPDKIIITYLTLGQVEAQLPATLFIRVHRSYLISLDHITAWSQSQVEIGRHSIPIGSSYAKDVLKRFEG
jgi:DNA-binding LytR/AlgR family response regulator